MVAPARASTSLLVGSGVGLAAGATISLVYFALQNRRPRVAYRLTDDRRYAAGSTVTEVVIWNAGRRPIAHGDLSEADPLRLTISGGELVGATVERMSRPTVDCSLFETPRAVIIDFELLGRRDGISLRVTHTGRTMSALSIPGTICGRPDGARPEVSYRNDDDRLVLGWAAAAAVPTVVISALSNRKALPLCGWWLISTASLFAFRRERGRPPRSVRRRHPERIQS